MSVVVNKANPSVFRVSVSWPDYSPSEWLNNPSGFSSLFNVVASRYWKLTADGDDIEEMSQSERDAVDAAIIADELASQRQNGKDVHDDASGESRALRAVVRLLVDELNIIRTWLVDYKSVIADSSNLAQVKTRTALLPNTPDRTYVQARTAIDNVIDGE